MQFDTTLRQHRLSRGLTLAQLAEKSGVSLSTLSQLERGLQPSIATLASLATALGVDVRDLAAPVLQRAVANSISANAAISV